MDIKFNSAYELYNKVLPALRVKRRELNKKGKNVKENEIFLSLIKDKWKEETNLTLNEVVNDILNYNGNDITY